MVNFVDVPLDVGSPKRAAADLDSAITESRNGNQTTQRQVQQTTTDDVDPRFRGKSTAEIVNMYKNLESHSGRLASQLGENKQMLNQLILGKRQDDIRQNSGPKPELKPTDLLANPTEALDRYLSVREEPRVSQLQERLNKLEAQLGQTRFTSKHQDADTVTADPAFAAWVQQTPLRMRLAQSAANNNYEDADLLLTEWRQSQGSRESSVTNEAERQAALAARVGLEGNNTGSESGNSASTRQGRTFKRADLIALRQSDPDKYESPSYQREIVQAYREGRVVD